MLLRCSSPSSIKWQDHAYGQRFGALPWVSGSRELGFSLKRKSGKVSCSSSRTSFCKALGDERLDLSRKVVTQFQTKIKVLRSDSGVVPRVAIIMGSGSDLPVMKAAAEVLQTFDVPFEIAIISAHRAPQRMCSFASQAHERGFQVIIAGAGGAAHLPGNVASRTPLPVIGVPVKGSFLGGIDSLLSIVQDG